MELQEFFTCHPRVAIAFSGGVDSAYLFYEAVQWGAVARAYYVKSAFQPQFEWEDAKRLAELIRGDLRLLEADVLSECRIVSNPPDRCYYCKKAMFSVIERAAAEDGFPVILDGTNASDDAGDRPGMQALREQGILSPLRECGLTKEEIRHRSRRAGLFTGDKPAYACLATRIPTGTKITGDMLRRTEEAEAYLFSLGFTDFRVRMMGDGARLQVPEGQLPRVLMRRDEILKELKKCYSCVLLDLEVRSE